MVFGFRIGMRLLKILDFIAGTGLEVLNIEQEREIILLKEICICKGR